MTDYLRATLTPAYGRDYRTATQVIEDFYKGKDFVFNNIANRYHGSYCSCRDFQGGTILNFRYHKNMKVFEHTIDDSRL